MLFCINIFLLPVRLDIGSILGGITNQGQQNNNNNNKDPLASIVGGVLDNVNVGLDQNGQISVGFNPNRPNQATAPTPTGSSDKAGTPILSNVPLKSYKIY